MSANDMRQTATVLSAAVDALSWEQALTRTLDWASRHESRYVCITNVHSVVTAGRDTRFCDVVRNADMVTPEGAPVAWMLRRLGLPEQRRINGPDLMWKFCGNAARNGQAIYLYGGSRATLSALERRLTDASPSLRVSGAESPPFRPLTAGEGESVLDVGCGNGHLLFHLRHRFRDLVGLEFSAHRLEQAKFDLVNETFVPVLGSAENMREIASCRQTPSNIFKMSIMPSANWAAYCDWEARW